MLDVSCLTENQVIQINELSQTRESGSDRFRVVGLIRGGMGICLRVQNEASGNEYALKTVQTPLVEDRRLWAMFVEEMKTWLTLSACDGVVEAYCITRINELPYVCAEWMNGGNLRTLMTERNIGSFYENTIRIVRTLEWAYARHKNIHRDIKPENLLLDNHGHAFVTDWGIARRIAIESDPTSFGARDKPTSRPELTEAGEFLGTILYASPEQIMGFKNIDHRSDIYSLGCVLYEWETGYPPFVGETADEIAYKHLNEPVHRLGGLFRRTNFGVEKIIERCLEKDPSQRFQDYAAFADALLAVAHERSVTFLPYVSRSRYSMPQIGGEEFRERVRSGTLGNIHSENGGHFIVEFEEIAPYIREADALMAIGEWQKASDIYGSLFVPEVTRSTPDYDHCQGVAVNYANCLIHTDNPKLAVSVLQCLSRAHTKPAEYFVNLSLAYLHLQEADRAEEVAREGLAIYQSDKDICGNLLISQTYQGKHSEALKTAQTRLGLGRDVHSLEETANLFVRLGDAEVDVNLPEAVRFYRNALDLLDEGKHLNSRFVTARFSFADVLFKLHQYSETMDELTEMANLPMHRSILERSVVLRARCLDRVALHRECVDFCDKWLKQQPENMELQRIRAETMVDGFCIGVEEDGTRVVERSSLQFFESIVKQNDRQVSDLCYLGRLYEWMGRIDEAMDLLGEAYKLAPGYWEIPFNKASFQLRLNQLDNSLVHALRATQMAPWRPQTWRLLAKIYDLLNLGSEAKSALHKAEYTERKRQELFTSTA